MLRILLTLTLVLCLKPASAHDAWANGVAVPDWVKASCCGPEDVHHLNSSQVHAMADGWHVDGYPQVLAYGRELPSQDGDYWIFYRHNVGEGKPSTGEDNESFSPVYCFFAPIKSF